MNRISNEPVVTAGAIAGLISAFLVWIRIMGWLDWTQEQFEAFMVFVSLLLPIAGALVARRFVRPVSKMSDNEKHEMAVTLSGEYPQ